jgi:hypothetical protein
MIEMEPEKVVRDGRVAVLISPGFGAGWSTMASEEQRDILLFDRRFVLAAEQGKDQSEAEAIRREIFGCEDVYCGGWRDIEIHWLPEGTRFAVEEYDGSESLRTIEDLIHTA